MPGTSPTGGYYYTVTDPWATWTSNGTVSTTTNYVVWQWWTGTGSTTISANGPETIRGCIPKTAEEATERARQADEYAEELAERRRLASERARQRREAEILASQSAAATLRLLLDSDQWAAWVADAQFVVTTPAGRRYLVKRGYAGNVRLLDGVTEVETLCCHPGMYDDEMRRLPDEDAVIAQVLALRHDEAGFRRTANITRLGLNYPIVNVAA
jgi:hypothetical protein